MNVAFKFYDTSEYFTELRVYFEDIGVFQVKAHRSGTWEHAED
jgi:hypothetical protein